MSLLEPTGKTSGIGIRGRVVQLCRSVVEYVADAVPEHQQDRDETNCYKCDDERVLDHPLAGILGPERLPERMHDTLGLWGMNYRPWNHGGDGFDPSRGDVGL